MRRSCIARSSRASSDSRGTPPDREPHTPSEGDEEVGSQAAGVSASMLRHRSAHGPYDATSVNAAGKVDRADRATICWSSAHEGAGSAPPGAPGKTVDQNRPGTLQREAVWSARGTGIGDSKREIPCGSPDSRLI